MTRWSSPAARNYLSQFSGGERVYRVVLAEADKANPSINFNKKFPGSAEVVVDRTEVSGAFTKGGWTFMQNALQNLPKYFSGEQWVLGQESSSNIDLSKLATDLRSRYQQDFIGQWRAFLNSGNVVRYGGLADAAQKLLKLSGNQVPAPGSVVRRGSEHGGRPTRCGQGLPACHGGGFTKLPGSNNILGTPTSPTSRVSAASRSAWTGPTMHRATRKPQSQCLQP